MPNTFAVIGALGPAALKAIAVITLTNVFNRINNTELDYSAVAQAAVVHDWRNGLGRPIRPIDNS